MRPRIKQRLDVNLVANADCTITAFDQSEIHPTEDYQVNRASIEFVTHKDELIFNKIELIINTGDIARLRAGTTFTLPKDGLYTYYKLFMPVLKYFYKPDLLAYEMIEEGGTPHAFYYKENVYQANPDYFQDTRYIYLEDETGHLIDLDSEINEKCSKITDIWEIWKLWENDSNIFWYSDSIFSICKLKQCLVNMQTNLLKDFAKNGCDISCSRNYENVVKRDFLLSSVFVLEHLLDLNQRHEAERILDQLFTCGDDICGNLNNENSGGCNCGKSL